MKAPVNSISEVRVRNQVIDRIIRSANASLSPLELAQELGFSEAQMCDYLADMDVENLIDVWDHPDGPRVTLSTLTASRRGVRLVTSSDDQSNRWASTEQPDPPPPRARRVCSATSFDALQSIVDPHPSAETVAMTRESLSTQTNEQQDQGIEGRHRGFPLLLLGETLTPWPGPQESPIEVCPSCQSQHLAPHMYCLLCDRSGLDRCSKKSNKVIRNRSRRKAETNGLLSDPNGETWARVRQAERADRKRWRRLKMQRRIENEQTRRNRKSRLSASKTSRS